jgi:lincosamide nucleotidyltransferase A/C/D/E
MYELLGNGRLHYGSVTAPFVFTEHDLCGRGEIAGIAVRCERLEFALQNRTGYEVRDTDRHDVAVLCEHFGIPPPHGYRE